jgi:hypothetical protein
MPTMLTIGYPLGRRVAELSPRVVLEGLDPYRPHKPESQRLLTADP